MRFISKDSISHIIIMRNLHLIKKNGVFKLCGIAYYCSLSDNCFSSDKSTVTDFCIFSNNNRSVNAGCRRNLCCFCNPDVSFSVFILLRIQGISKLYNKISDFRKHFPRICFSLKQFRRYCLFQVQKFLNSIIFHHFFFPPRFESAAFPG